MSARGKCIFMPEERSAYWFNLCVRLISVQLQGIRVSIPLQSFYNKYEDTEHSRFLRLCRMRVIIKTFIRSICFFFKNSLMRKRPLFKITKSIFVGLKFLWELLNYCKAISAGKCWRYYFPWLFASWIHRGHVSSSPTWLQWEELQKYLSCG